MGRGSSSGSTVTRRADQFEQQFMEQQPSGVTLEDVRSSALGSLRGMVGSGRTTPPSEMASLFRDSLNVGSLSNEQILRGVAEVASRAPNPGISGQKALSDVRSLLDSTF